MGSGNGSRNQNKNKNKKKKKKNKSAKPGSEQEAVEYVANWAKFHRPPAEEEEEEEGAYNACVTLPIIDLHTHSTFSDGMLTPTELVERSFRKGVKVLALTDHDTMAGVEEAIAAADKYGIRVIPGVEISAKVGQGDGGDSDGESVHILAYYGCCGPSDCKSLEESLRKIREGRFSRARTMVKKLQYLNKPVYWERVMELVGDGGAPGRPHVARALLEAGHVQSLQHAYKKYLHDGGPAYASGDEIPAEEVVHLICHTGGVAALAHPWTLKNPRPLIRRLKAAGLHAMEAHKSSGKISEFTQMAEEFNLLKLGGSDYHGTGAPNEVDLGKVLLPAKVFCEFLKLAQPIWSAALKSMVHDYANSSISQQSASMIIEELSYHTTHFCSRKSSLSCGCVSTDKNSGIHGILKFSQWLRKEDRELLMAEASNLGLKYSSSIDLSGRVTIVLFGTWQEVKVAHYS